MKTPPKLSLPSLQHAVDETSLWLLFALIGGSGASVLALGLLLRSNQALTSRVIAGTVMHSLVWGVAVFLLLMDYANLSLPATLALAIFSGMGTASFIDIVLLVVKQRLGVSVTINPPPQGHAPAGSTLPAPHEPEPPR
jgi:hypothetical protein